MREAIAHGIGRLAREWAAPLAIAAAFVALVLLALALGVPWSTIYPIAKLVLLAASAALFAVGIVMVWRVQRRLARLRTPDGMEQDLAMIDRRIAAARKRPNGTGDRALADALVAKNAFLCLLDRLGEAYAVQDEAMTLAANSSDPVVRARAPEFAAMMEGAPDRPLTPVRDRTVARDWLGGPEEDESVR
jgi:hypothetical protein